MGTDHRSVAAHCAPRGHVCSRERSQRHAENRTQNAVDEAKAKEQRSGQGHGEIIDREIGAEPQQEHLQQAHVGRRMPFALGHSDQASSLETRETFDPGIPSFEPRELGDVRPAPSRKVVRKVAVRNPPVAAHPYINLHP